MTSHDYHLVMTSARIAELKSRLSEYLRLVRAGNTVEVFDRDRKVARIVPAEGGSPLQIRQPAGGPRPLRELRLPEPVPLQADAVALLLAERETRS